MAELKTKLTNQSVSDFINSVDNETRKQDSQRLMELFKDLTSEEAKMWGTSIIGFGSYHYKSERSRQEGDWPLIGFSPRKQNLTIYFMNGFNGLDGLLEKLGKHKTAKGCLYINKLSDVDLEILEQLILQSYSAMKQQYSG